MAGQAGGQARGQARKYGRTSGRTSGGPWESKRGTKGDYGELHEDKREDNWEGCQPHLANINKLFTNFE